LENNGGLLRPKDIDGIIWTLAATGDADEMLTRQIPEGLDYANEIERTRRRDGGSAG
jgi:hypothetical protein